MLAKSEMLLILLYDVKPVRSTMRQMPELKNLSLVVVRQAKRLTNVKYNPFYILKNRKSDGL